MEFQNWYNKNYKKILIIPTLLLAFSLVYLIFFYQTTGDIIYKDVSLTGGSTITVSTQESATDLTNFLSGKIKDFEIKTISDGQENQLDLSITVRDSNTEELKTLLEEFFGFKLTEENSSQESTSASLSSDFYNQLVVAMILAFFWMAAVVFIIFAKGKKVKTNVILLNILFGFFMGNYFLKLNNIISTIIFLAFAVVLIRLYVKNSIPALAVMISAFADITMTLVVVNLMGMQLSTAGIVAFLMLIGYSVDTDILLTTRVIQKRENTNSLIFGAFKTGMTMTLTSIVAVATALFVVYSFGSVLNQIFTILLIGLFFDMFNTWITNASIIKWYVEKQK